MNEKLNEDIAKLEARLKAKKKAAAKSLKVKKAKEKAELLKKDNRKKMLVGEAFLLAVESGKFPREKFDEIMSFHLEETDDRKLFGLEPLKK